MPKKKIDYEEDIKNTTIDDLVNEDLEPEKPEEKKEEPEKDPEKEVETPKNEVDVDAIKAEIESNLRGSIEQEVSGKVVEKLKSAFGLEEKEEKKTPWDKEGRNPTWTEALEYVANQTKEQLAAEAEAEAQKEAQEKAKAQEVEKSTVEQWNKYWDTQLTELEADGLMPKIESDKEDDPGRKARVALFETMHRVSSEREAKGLPAVTNLYEVRTRFYKDPTAQPAGADAPISGTRTASTADEGKTFTYADIRNSSIEDLVK